MELAGEGVDTIKVFFFCSQAVGSCNLVLYVHHRLIEKWKSVHDSWIGAMPIVQVKHVRLAKSGSWIQNTKTAKARAGPARNAGTPRPGARRHGKRKNPPNNNMIQSSKTKVYRHPTVLCRDTFQWQVIKSKHQLQECRCETLIRYSHWTENRGYPGWPQAQVIPTALVRVVVKLIVTISRIVTTSYN